MHQKHAWRAVLSVAADRVKSQVSALLLVGGVFALVIGTIGLIVGLGLLSQQQDLRQQASSPTGTVEISLRPPTNPTSVNQTLPIIVDLNTKNMQVDGVQLAIILPKSFSNPTARIDSALPLQIVFQQLEESATTNILKLIVINSQISQPFATNAFQPILQIDSTPTQGGTFTVGADNSRSIVTQYDSDPPRDVLKPITSVPVTITGGSQITATPSPTIAAGGTPAPTPPCTTFTRPEQTSVSCLANQGLSISWTDTNPNPLHPAEEAGFKIYRIDNDPVYTQTGTPGNPPVATLPSHPGSGPMNYVFPDPEVRFGYIPGKFYRFLIYTWKEPLPGRPVGCWKQSAIGTTCSTSTIPTATPTPTVPPGIPSATPTPTAPATTPQPSVIPGCNALCRSDLECQSNYICYFGPTNTMDSGRCRLKTNPESLTCQPPVPVETPRLAFAAKLQGLSKPSISVKAQVWLVPLNHLDTAADIVQREYTFDLEMKTAADGHLYPTNQLILTNVPANQKYVVYLKTTWSLRRKLGEIFIAPGENKAPLDWVKFPLLVGDFITTPQEQSNKINILDLSAMLRVYTQLTTPVTATNQQFDVNYDSQIDILDLSLVLSNYTKLEVVGD